MRRIVASPIAPAVVALTVALVAPSMAGDHWARCQDERSRRDYGCNMQYDICLQTNSSSAGEEICAAIRDRCLETSDRLFEWCYGPFGPEPF